MKPDRRNFIKVAGAVSAIAATGVRLGERRAEGAPTRKSAHGALARGLTLLTLRRKGEYRLGVKTERGIVDVKETAASLHMPAPATLDELLQNEDGAALNALMEAVKSKNYAKAALIKEDAVEYGPLLTRPEKILCVGLNYRKHAEEVKQPVPKQPVLFNKFNNALNAHNGTIKLPVAVAKKFDYEVELVIVMGKHARNVSEAEAASYVAGYATGNDFTARDLQLETGGQWLIGKTPDQFAPIGPHLVTADQLDPDKLSIECRVNGEVRQSSNTSDFIFNTRQMISYMSQFITLKPGDIIFTGTPEGVIAGYPKDKQVWLKPGDKIVTTIEKLGELAFTRTDGGKTRNL